MLRKWFLASGLVFVTSLSVWLSQDPTRLTSSSTLHANTSPDSFMENFTTRSFDAQGKLQYEFQAALMQHFPHDKHREFTAPQFTAYRPHNQRWILSAEQGRSSHHIKQILLQGRVVMRRYSASDGPAELEIHTHDLTVIPDDSYAETSQPVVFMRTEGTIHAVGLQADFRAGKITLLSQVRGRYAP